MPELDPLGFGPIVPSRAGPAKEGPQLVKTSAIYKSCLSDPSLRVGDIMESTKKEEMGSIYFRFSEISSPEFAKAHYNVSTSFLSNCRLLCSVIPLPYICSLDEQIAPIPLDDRHFKNWGCCNGWICYSREPDKTPMLWNPSTRKVRRFRRSDAYNDNPNNELFKTVYGFGYDELTDDYEVVEIINPRSTCTISIYSVRRKCWKRLSDSPKSVDEYCYLVNGALHWQAHNRESNDLPSSILSINLSTEAYQELNFPQHEDQLSHDEQMDTRIGNWDVPTLEEVTLCGFALNDEDGVICGCHNIKNLTLQSCCYGGPNEIMKLVLNKLLVLKIEDWNDRGNYSKFSVNMDAPIVTNLVLVKHSPNLMFARPMNLKGAMFSLKRYRVNSWTYGNTIMNMLDQLRIETLRVSTGCYQAILSRKGEADTKINIRHTYNHGS
ncbi:hypothetical protein FXO38_15362 [Capsicum annuum]|nr:hypothetical protein FXO38_15362 [Capsicum annuum]